MLFGFLIVFFFLNVYGTPWDLNAYGTQTYEPSIEQVPEHCPKVDCPAMTTCNCLPQKPCAVQLTSRYTIPQPLPPIQDIRIPVPHAHTYEMPPALDENVPIYPKKPTDLSQLEILPSKNELEEIEAQTEAPFESDYLEETAPMFLPEYEYPSLTDASNFFDDENFDEAAQTPKPKKVFYENRKHPKTTVSKKLKNHEDSLQNLFATESPFRHRYLKRFLYGKKHFGTPSLTLRDIGRCNSLKLKIIMMENIEKTPSISKRAIQRAASAEIGGSFDVICSTHNFSYLANTKIYCETRISDIVCFAFLHSS